MFSCRNEGFDKDYVEFLSRMDSLTDKLQNKLESTYDGVWDTPHAFQYLPRFEKLSEVMPVGHLTEKYLRMINTFSQEMDRITRFFKKQVTKPPIPRNYPDSSGRIGNLIFSKFHFGKPKNDTDFDLCSLGTILIGALEILHGTFQATENAEKSPRILQFSQAIQRNWSDAHALRIGRARKLEKSADSPD